MSKEKDRNNKFKVSTRPSYTELGIGKERLCELQDGCRTGIYNYKLLHKAAEGILCKEHILLSVVKNKTFENVEYDEKLGRICVCRTDFYALRRQFYHNLDCLLKDNRHNESS